MGLRNAKKNNLVATLYSALEFSYYISKCLGVLCYGHLTVPNYFGTRVLALAVFYNIY